MMNKVEEYVNNNMKFQNMVMVLCIILCCTQLYVFMLNPLFFFEQSKINASCPPSNNTTFLKKTQPSSYAFALLSTESHWRYTYALAHRLRTLSPLSYDIIILTSSKNGRNLSHDATHAFARLNATVVTVNVPVPETVKPIQPEFIVSWDKLHLFTMTQYDKILYLDTDIVVLKDMSPLFLSVHSFASVPLTCDASIDPGGLNGGILLVLPNMTLYNELLTFASKPNPTSWSYSEQQLLVEYFVWTYPERFVPLSTHFMGAVNGLNDQGLHTHYGNGHHWLFLDKQAVHMLSRFYAIHFVCENKPWDTIGWNHCNQEEEGGKKGDTRCHVVRLWQQYYSSLSLNLI